MKTEIDKQSKNEVKDLLDEYVVSPLNGDISKKLSEMNKVVDSLKGELEDKLKESSAPLNSRIDNLKRQLDNSFHFAGGEDAFETVREAIDDSSKEIIKIVKDANKTLVEYFEQNEKSLSEIKEVSESNKKEMLSKSSSNFKALKGILQTSIEDIEKSRTNILDELSSLSILQTEAFKQSNELSDENKADIITRLQDVEERINEQIKQLNEEIHIISEDLSTQKSMISDYRQETAIKIQDMNTRQEETLNKNFKTLLAVSLAFGIINVIGIIAMISLNLLN